MNNLKICGVYIMSLASSAVGSYVTLTEHVAEEIYDFFTVQG